jgi:hypothetical protein
MRPHTSLVPQRPTRSASSCTIEDAIATALERVPLREAMGRFTQAAYGQKLDFEHA